jgi:hypothetical protein
VPRKERYDQLLVRRSGLCVLAGGPGFAGRKPRAMPYHAHEVLIAKGWYTHARDIERWLADSGLRSPRSRAAAVARLASSDNFLPLIH